MKRTGFVAIVSTVLIGIAVAHADQHPPPTADGLAIELKAGLERRLQSIARDLDGVLGYAVLDAVSGETILARLPSEGFPTASTIKLAILYEMFKQADEGRLSLDEPILLDRAQVVGGSGVLQHLTRPTLSLRDHAALMIIVSDNSATNILIDAVGTSAINDRMKALGLADLQLRRKMMDTAAARRGEENVSSPSALGQIALKLWRGEGLSQGSRDKAVGILRHVTGRFVPPRLRRSPSRARPAGSRVFARKPAWWRWKVGRMRWRS